MTCLWQNFALFSMNSTLLFIVAPFYSILGIVASSMDLLFYRGKNFHDVCKRFAKVLIARRNYGASNRAVIIGIETSCDDTGCAVVDSNGNILGEALNSQHLIHLNHGGIVPPIAQAMHRKNITEICEKALRSANLRLRDVDAIAATVKPGLPLSLQIGTNFGKYLSILGDKPFIPIHHMEAHALTARMVEKVDFPFLVLLVSGGHCLLAVVKDAGTFYLLGKTLDDAPGEAFDKAARRMKIRNIPDYRDLNGGTAIELAASRATNPSQFVFDPTMAHYRDCNFSFAGLKNTVCAYAIKQERKYDIMGDSIIPDLNNLCAGFQMAVTKHLCNKTKRAMEYCIAEQLLPKENPTLVVSGGVACNNFIAKGLGIISSEMGYKFVRPPARLCTDNGIMIAWNGIERWIANDGVIRDPEEIAKVTIQKKAPLGEDWTLKVAAQSIPCKTLRTKDLYDS